MVQSSSGVANNELLSHYTKEFTRLSGELFYKRARAIERVIGDRFDDPCYAEIIERPADNQSSSLSLCMVWREARFVLADVSAASDVDAKEDLRTQWLSEETTLRRRWERLFAEYAAQGNKVTDDLLVLSRRNRYARLMILRCRGWLLDDWQDMLGYCALDQHSMVRVLGDQLLRCIDGMFREVVASY